MDTDQLEAQRCQTIAQHHRAIISVDTAKSPVMQRNAERTAAAAVIAQRETQLDSAEGFRIGRSIKASWIVSGVQVTFDL